MGTFLRRVVEGTVFTLKMINKIANKLLLIKATADAKRGFLSKTPNWEFKAPWIAKKMPPVNANKYRI